MPDNRAKFVFTGLSAQNLLTVADLKSICELEQDFIADYFQYSCPAHSVPFYIAANGDKTCWDIEQGDVDAFTTLLKNCSIYYEQGILLSECNVRNCPSIPPRCYKNNAVYKSFRYLLDMDFRATLHKPEPDLKTTMMLLQNYYSKDTVRTFYNTKVDGKDLKSGDVEIAAMEVGYTFDLFLEYIISDLYLFAIALILVSIILYLYLGSGMLVFATFMNVLFSFWVGYFVYHIVFRFDFFPFTNIVTLLLLIAIGADDIFIFVDSWQEAKVRKHQQMDDSSSNDKMDIVKHEQEPGMVNNNRPTRSEANDIKSSTNNNTQIIKQEQYPETVSDNTSSEADNADTSSDIEYLVSETFHHANKSILITSLTTSAAMFANFASSITMIRCFGIFTMTCILVNFLLMVTWVPCLMVLKERSRSLLCAKCSCNTWGKIKDTASGHIRKFYGEMLPYFITKLKYPLIAVFTLGGIAGIVVVFITPKFQLPSSTYFPCLLAIIRLRFTTGI